MPELLFFDFHIFLVDFIVESFDLVVAFAHLLLISIQISSKGNNLLLNLSVLIPEQFLLCSESNLSLLELLLLLHKLLLVLVHESSLLEEACGW